MYNAEVILCSCDVFEVTTTYHVVTRGFLTTSKMSKGGYDCNFVSLPDEDLKCLICLEVSRDPLQHEACGKLFCKSCIEEYGRDKPCPHCQVEKVQYFVDNRSKRVAGLVRWIIQLAIILSFA